GFDEWRGGAGRQRRRVRRELLVQPDQRALLVLSDEEPHHDHRTTRTRRRVEVLDTGDFPQELLNRAGHALLDLRGRGTWHVDEDVDHRHDDLRLFLPRKRDDSVATE